MNNMPNKLRKECAADPEYTHCMRRKLLRDHSCQSDPITGKLIEWEHAMMFQGRQLQKKWAIIPICWLIHRGGKLDKEINMWIALNRATVEELREISSAVDYQMHRDWLNKKYVPITD